MDYNYLPNTKIKVSKICLGTMTWGRQNNQDEAFDQMNYSIDRGVNFFDTAELYPVPASPDKYAITEEIIGNWFHKSKKRDKVILATKIAGPPRLHHAHSPSTPLRVSSRLHVCSAVAWPTAATLAGALIKLPERS